jgi:hypothetical protein
MQVFLIKILNGRKVYVINSKKMYKDIYLVLKNVREYLKLV